MVIFHSYVSLPPQFFMAPLSPAAVFAPRSDIPPLAAAVLRPPGRERSPNGAGTEFHRNGMTPFGTLRWQEITFE